MAVATPVLGLVLPANNEFFNSWDGPNNKNFTLIDTAVGVLQTEVQTARGSTGSLSARLAAVINTDGTPLPTPEVLAAEVSAVYGGTTPGSLGNRIGYNDNETFDARQSLAALRDGLAFGADFGKNNSVISTTSNYLGFTGATVTISATPSAPCVANINGYRQVLSVTAAQASAPIATQTTISGGSGTYYLTLTRSAVPAAYLTGTSTGVIDAYPTNGLVARLTDSGKNFVTSGVKPGDVLNVTGPSLNPNIGRYIVLATNTQDATNLTTSQVAVIGQFVAIGSSLSYTILDPIAPVLGFTATAPAKSFARVTNKIYIGECSYTTGSPGTVNSVITYALNGTYAAFTSYNSATYYSAGTMLTVPHNLGYVPSKVQLYGSQASDFSSPLELLGYGATTSGAGTERSIVAKVDRLNVYVYSPVNSRFYTDFDGTTVHTGTSLYAQVER